MDQAPGRSAIGAVTGSIRPSVLIVCDVLLYREGLAASLALDGRLSVVATSGADEALAIIGQKQPDAVLLDGGMADFLLLARRIRAEYPRLRIVGFGISGGVDQLVDCAEFGLAAFVGSGGSLDDLVTGVNAALRGELSCSPRLSALMCDRLATLAAGARDLGSLTNREREIALLIGHGLSNKEIANKLKIGAATVKNHVHSILEKLNVRRRSAIGLQIDQAARSRETC